MKTKMNLWTGGLAMLAVLFVMSSCAPIFSELQSARTAGKNNLELTAGFSAVDAKNETESGDVSRENLQNHFGLHAAYGITEDIDVRMRFEHLWVTDEGGNTNVIGFGPKVELIEQWLAFYVPVGFAFGGDMDDTNPMDTWEIHPTLLFSVPLSDKFEVNTSVKYIQALEKGGWKFMAFNLGLGISSDLDKYVIRPEIGWAQNLDDREVNHLQLSVGATFYPFRIKK